MKVTVTPIVIGALNIVTKGDHRVKSKESEKKEKYPEPARELNEKYGSWKWRWHQL